MVHRVGIAILSATRGGFDSHFEAFGELRDRVHGHAHGGTGPPDIAAEGGHRDSGQGTAGR
jgi:hypothetical protein